MTISGNPVLSHFSGAVLSKDGSAAVLGQPLARNHAFERILKKNRALRAHFFFPCINSEVHAPGIYEFARQILFHACCRTRHNPKRLISRPKQPRGAVWNIFLSDGPYQRCASGHRMPRRQSRHQRSSAALQRPAALPLLQRKHSRTGRRSCRWSACGCRCRPYPA